MSTLDSSFTPHGQAAKSSVAFLVCVQTVPWQIHIHIFYSTGRKEILDGMLSANLVCFQTYSYSRHFTSSCVRVCGYEVAARGIDVQGHVTSVMHSPVGVDAERFSRDL